MLKHVWIKNVGMALGCVVFFVCAGLFWMVSPAEAGPRWEVGEEGWLQLSVLGQIHFAGTRNANPENDFFLRRGRMIFKGQIQDGIIFFMDTDYPNAGRNNANTEFFLQDAMVDFRLGDSKHWVAAGLVILPFSFENMSGVVPSLGIDKNGESFKMVNTKTTRDMGLQFHGLATNDRLAYRLSVCDGYDETPADASLRLTGHLEYNLKGKARTSWLYAQNPLGGEYLYVGAGIDQQDKAGGAPAQDSENTVFDFQSGWELKSFHLTANGAYYDYDNSVFKGNISFIELGALFDKKRSITLKHVIQEQDGQDDVKDSTAGVHYFIKGHNVRVGLEYRWGDSPDFTLLGLQFFF